MTTNKETLRVLVVDDHPLVIAGIKTCLKDISHIVVVGEAANGEEALHKAKLLLPDIVLADITMPVMNGLELTRQLKKLFPGMKVLVLTIHDSKEYIFQILQAGAKGYMLKDSTPQELIQAIESVGRGERFFSPGVSKILVDDYLQQTTLDPIQDEDKIPADIRLTQREEDVLDLVAQSLTNKEIAERLGIKLGTVLHHRENLRKKLKLHNTAALTKFALSRKKT